MACFWEKEVIHEVIHNIHIWNFVTITFFMVKVWNGCFVKKSQNVQIGEKDIDIENIKKMKQNT